MATKKSKLQPVSQIDQAKIVKEFLEKNDSDNVSTECFKKQANDDQIEYTRKLIEHKIERDEINFDYSFATPFAEMFERSTGNVYSASWLLYELLEMFAKKETLHEHFKKHPIHINASIELMGELASFLSNRAEDENVRLFFDREDLTWGEIKVSDLEGMQDRYIERKPVVNSTWVYDLQFDEPFCKLSESAKVDRLRNYLLSRHSWSGNENELILPDHVAQYLPLI